MNMRVSGAVALAGVVAMSAGAAFGQAFGPRANQFPDIIVSTVGTRGGNGVGQYGSFNDGTGAVSSYAFASDSCNIGTHAGIWINEGTYQNQHPVIGGQVYRLFNGRFEQIGISWLKHGFCAADSCSTVNGVAGCTNLAPNAPGTSGCVTDYGAPQSGCDWLGYGRATDTYSSSLNGAQGSLGPRSEVNPWSGQYPHPWGKNGNNPVSCLNKRLLIRKSNLDPAQYPGAQYFGEIVYIMTDEWPGQRYNNYSYRKLTVGTTPTLVSGCGGSETTYPLSFAANDTTVAMKPALEAWKVADPAVKIATVDVPNDGRYYVASKATNRGDGTWNYEYAVLNMNSDRGARSFMIPKSESASVQITLPNNTFRGVEYHSGEGYELTPWTSTANGSNVEWSTYPHGEKQNANALRWSTTYNFRMISNRPPTSGTVQIGLFKPATVVGDPSTVDVTGVDVPTLPPPCAADVDGREGVTIDDIFVFLNAWFGGCTGSPDAPCNGVNADFDRQNGITIDDIFGYLNAWFAGCP